ncbi:hypothetical protein [Streptomyces syringium]|uniref:hypothetical protein n=1 Tax=Streptomyces syringium TaxID=76729 RepID=UPI00343DD99B
MTTQYRIQRRRRLGLIAATLLGSLTVSACSRTGSEAGAGKKDTPAIAKTLRLGQPSPETQDISRYNKTGKFIITPQKVVEGKPEDLRDLGDDNKYANQKLVWVYVNAKLTGGDAVKGPMMMTNIGAEAGAGHTATQLILIGDLSGRPKDCVGEDTEAAWKQGDTRTVCAPYLIPAASKVTQVTYFRGFHAEPLKWAVQ